MEQDKIIHRLRRQLLAERLAIALLLFFFLGRYAAGSFFGAPYSIEVDGKPVAFVESRQLAESVIAEAKKGPGAEFRETVTIGRGSSQDKAQPLAAAVKALQEAATVMVEAWVIMIDGQPSVALPTEEDASQILNRARERFGSMVENLMEVPTFKEDVKVEPTLAEASTVIADTDAALDKLIAGSPQAGAGSGNREHVVQNGQLAGQVAQQHGLNLDQLSQLNPGRNLDRLQIGDRLIVGRGDSQAAAMDSQPAGAPRLTVVVRDSITRTESMPYTTETVSSLQMVEGKRLVLSPGRAGSRAVKRAVTYENGVRTGSEIVEETVISKPVPERVAVGIRRR